MKFEKFVFLSFLNVKENQTKNFYIYFLITQKNEWPSDPRILLVDLHKIRT